ncbi:MAG: ABC transporter substrate-binding protein [Candidatus Kerfeldbacteria bacterium]
MLHSLRTTLNRIFRRRASVVQAPDTHADAERRMVYTLAKSRLPTFRQLRYLPTVASSTERLLLLTLSGFVIVSLLFLGARAYARNVTLLPRSGGGIVEAIVGTPQYLNPILVSTNDVDRDLVAFLYAGLFKRNGAQKIEPDLAESYEVSTDNKVYTVHLRKGLAWSDGTPLTSDDVLLTFELIQDSLYKSPLRGQFKNMKVERLDETSVRFTLTQPTSAFFSSLTVGILPAHIWGDVPPPSFALIEYNIKPIGAGPYQFESLKRDASTGAIKEYHLVRNKQYHGSCPYLNEYTFKIFMDTESALQALRSKKVDSISVVTAEQRAEAKQVRLIDLQIPQYTALFINTKRPVLKTIEVRNALATAVDRNDLVSSILRGSALVVDGPIPPNMPGYAGPLQPGFNVDEANRILENAGWKRTDSGNVRKKGNDELAFSLSVSDVPEDLVIAEKLKAAWEKVGAKVEIKSFDTSRIAKEIIKPRSYDVFLYGEILSVDADLYPFWHSSQERDPGLNLTNFYNKDADKLLEELRTAVDPAVIAEKRIAFQKLLAKDLPAIFLYSPLYTYGLSKRVKGFDVAFVTNPSDRFADISKWYVKTKIAFK